MMTRALLVSMVLAALTGCGGSTRGVVSPTPPATGVTFARASVDEPDGLRVLLAGRTSGTDFSTKAWVANEEVELEVLWNGVQPEGRPPQVDFSRYVVFGLAFEGGVCPPKILGIRSEASGLLSLEHDPDSLFQTCILLAVREARVVAVPRRVLPSPVVYLWGHRFLLDEPLHPVQ